MSESGRSESKSRFMSSLSVEIFSAAVNTPGIVEYSVDEVVLYPSELTMRTNWLNMSMLAPRLELMEDTDPLKTLQFIGRLASPQLFATTLECIKDHPDRTIQDRYNRFVLTGADYITERLGIAADMISPSEIALGLAAGNMQFYGSHLPWLILAGIYGEYLADNTTLFSQSGKLWELTEEVIQATSDIPTVQERLAAIFGPSADRPHLSYGVALLNSKDRFVGKNVRCPATKYVNLSFLRMSEHIMSDRFLEETNYY